MKHQLFFVYGTLKKGFPNNHLLHSATLLGEHETDREFTMYDLSNSYPAVVKIGGFSIKGEVYKVTSLYTIQTLYALEGYTGIKNDPKNYYELIKIDTKWGEANMFVFKEPPMRPIVTTGVWTLK